MTPEEKCQALAEILQDLAQEVAGECTIYAPSQVDDSEISKYIMYRTLVNALRDFMGHTS